MTKAAKHQIDVFTNAAHRLMQGASEGKDLPRDVAMLIAAGSWMAGYIEGGEMEEYTVSGAPQPLILQPDERVEADGE